MRKIWKHRYQIVEEAGKGGTANVYKVWDLHLEKEWAMKILEDRVPGSYFSEEQQEIMDELKALKRISHPNFPRIVDAFEEEGKSVLIMDYIRGITLEEVIARGPVKEEEMGQILSQICDALLYLHQCTPVLLYLDLKPSNVMIEENKTVKLIDLGSVSMKGIGGKISGSFGYASPEQVKVQRDGIYLREQSDIFSFGMVLYAMATGSSTKLPVIEGRSRHGIFIRRENPFLSVPLEKIIEKCTRGNCNRRYSSMREVKKEIESWESYLKKKRKVVWGIPSWGRRNRKQWYQEKSIFCTEGRHSFYIAKKIMVLLVCILSLVPGKAIMAGEKTGKFWKEDGPVRQEAGKFWKEDDPVEQEAGKFWKEDGLMRQEAEVGNKELGVIIRDHKFRKVLIKKGCAYKTNSNLLLEIPWEEMEGESYRILVECEGENIEAKRFYMECIYTK